MITLIEFLAAIIGGAEALFDLLMTPGGFWLAIWLAGVTLVLVFIAGAQIASEGRRADDLIDQERRGERVLREVR